MIEAEHAEPFYPKDTQPLVYFILPHHAMVQRFGVCHRVMDKDDNEPGPCEYWSFQFPCGLVTFITYHFDNSAGAGGVVTASSPDIEHILQHLPILDCMIWRLDRDETAFYQSRYGIVSGSPCLMSTNH